MYSSEDCQQLLKMYDNFYPQSGFRIPWIGYFILRQNQIVGSCGFVGHTGKEVEIAYWTLKSLKDRGSRHLHAGNLFLLPIRLIQV